MATDIALNPEGKLIAARFNTPYYQAAIDTYNATDSVVDKVDGVYPIHRGGGYAAVPSGTTYTLNGSSNAITFETGDAACNIASGSANDASGGTGVTLLGVVYIKAGVMKYIQVVPTGVTPVTLGDTASNINEIFSITVGSTGSNAGLIEAITGTTQQSIAATDNRSQNGVFTVGTGYELHIDRIYLSAELSNGVGFFMRRVAVAGPNEMLATISPGSYDVAYRFTAGQTAYMNVLNLDAATSNMCGGFSGVLYKL